MSSPADASSRANRCLLWVDAVGGFLVCWDDHVTLGQAVPGNRVDVPILGDISRRHAVVERRQGEYLLHPVGPTSLRGRVIEDAATLRDGDELQLASRVRLRFRKPHPLSATARLDVLSHHGMTPSCDAVILMAATCVLGPAANAHVLCRGWPQPLVLSREQGNQFRYQSSEPLEVDGMPAGRQELLPRNARLVSASFALSVEEL